MTKKILLVPLALVFLFMPFITQAAWAPQDISFDKSGNILRNTKLGQNDPIVLTSGIINWFLGILGLLALVLIVYAGFKWMLSRGDEGEVEEAMDIIKGAVIGLVIVLASYGIAYYVFNNLLNITNA